MHKGQMPNSIVKILRTAIVALFHLKGYVKLLYDANLCRLTMIDGKLCLSFQRRDGQMALFIIELPDYYDLYEPQKRHRCRGYFYTCRATAAPLEFDNKMRLQYIYCVYIHGI